MPRLFRPNSPAAPLAGEGDDSADRRAPPRARRAPRPLDAARLDEMALAYVARFATSAGKLEAYLLRKLRERGWVGPSADVREDDDETEGASEAARAQVAAILARFETAGYIDDAGYARARSSSLQRRGLGARRIVQALGEAGIAEPLRAAALPGEGAARRAALACARRRRLGPFAREVPDRPTREKHIAALLRAGHGLAMARALVDSESIEAAETWAAEPGGDEEDGSWGLF